MKRIKRFFITSMLGGVLVILPIVLIIWVFSILVNFMVTHIEPLTMVINKFVDGKFFSVLIAMVLIILICFLVGMFVRTKMGNWIHNNVEEKMLSKIPGYKMVKGALTQLFMSDKKTRPFSKVVLFRLFNNDVLLTGIVTDDEHDEYMTVFCPTAPNPTSGFIYHVPRKDVFEIDESVEDTMRTVLSGGFGSNVLISKYMEKYGHVKSKDNKDTSSF